MMTDVSCIHRTIFSSTVGESETRDLSITCQALWQADTRTTQFTSRPAMPPTFSKHANILLLRSKNNAEKVHWNPDSTNKITYLQNQTEKQAPVKNWFHYHRRFKRGRGGPRGRKTRSNGKENPSVAMRSEPVISGPFVSVFSRWNTATRKIVNSVASQASSARTPATRSTLGSKRERSSCRAVDTVARCHGICLSARRSVNHIVTASSHSFEWPEWTLAIALPKTIAKLTSN